MCMRAAWPRRFARPLTSACLPPPAPLPCFLPRSAAGRGLNLQSSDTVVIYDPDPNPKNEEQAIARCVVPSLLPGWHALGGCGRACAVL